MLKENEGVLIVLKFCEEVCVKLVQFPFELDDCVLGNRR